MMSDSYGATGADRELIYEALRFYFWAAGQGISPDSAEPALEPEEGFWQYSQRTGDENWETIADRYRASQMVLETETTAWLIEYGPSAPSRPRYWGGVHGWTFDHLQAVRFARQVDAQSIAESMDDGVPGNYRIAEHMWITERVPQMATPPSSETTP